jgi:hypothetical protein
MTALDAVSLRRHRSRCLSDAGLALVHRTADPQPARRPHARRGRSPGAGLSSFRDRPRREGRHGGDLGQSAEPGDYKYIGSFPHFVADAGDDRVGRWLDERIDLAAIYAEIWKDAARVHLVDVAVFCDSDDTHTASISYFAYVQLEQRCGSDSLLPAREQD